MNLKAGLLQKQELKHIMTQELSQAIALLQYSAQELTNFLESKALENPLITIYDAPIHYRNKKIKMDRFKPELIEQIADNSFSVEEHLLSQLNLKKFSNSQLTIITALMQDLDENGYFRGDIHEISIQKNVQKHEVEEGLKVVQGLEPAGIGARNLQECLLIQTMRKYPADGLAIKIVRDYFHLFVEKKWMTLANELSISLAEIQNIFDRIQALNPKPGLEFSTDQTHFIVPDAIIEVTKEGISVRLWEMAVPKINFNSKYYKKFTNNGDYQVNMYIQNKFEDFQWIMKGIAQRRETLSRVIMKIAEMQEDYFLKSPDHLRPMSMKKMAQELGVHESTISRAVREKYVQTPAGTVPLKSFFTSSIHTISNVSASSTQVKRILSIIIEKENKQDPFSDQELVKILKQEENIIISRRSVAKYREQLGIASSANRRRY